MSELIFYTNPQSRGQIVRWMLEETGEDYQEEIVEYGPAMKSPEYLAINPMGKVPAVVHKGKVITECAGICAYLAAAFPERGLAPLPEEQADYYRWMFFASGPFEAAITNRAMGWVPNEEQQRMAGYGNYELAVATLDAKLGESKYICGERFTGADVYLGSHIDFGLMFGSLDPTPNFERYVELLRARPANQAAKARDMALMPDA